MKELKVAIQAAQEAGKILNRYFNSGLKVERKPDNTPVTRADREAEKKIVSTIRKHFPDHNFLCEEFQYKETDSPFRWIIDPLDGTKNFVRKVPIFATFIALEKGSKIVLGVINMPQLSTFAYAAKGRGTFINGKKVRVSRIKNIEESFFVFGDIDKLYNKGYGKEFSELIGKSARHRGFGQQLGYALVAQGSADFLVDTNLKPWDIAAGKIIVEEAGGRLTDFEGNDTVYSGNCIATNGILHDQVLNIINKR